MTRPHRQEQHDLLALLVRAQAGDQNAVERLLAMLYSPIRDYLLTKVRRVLEAGDLADDITQDTLIRMARKLDGCRARNETELVGWALAVARTQLINHLRTQRVQERLTDLPDLYAPVMETGGLTDLLGRLVRTASKAVPRETLELLRLRVEGGLSWREVAAVMETTSAGAKRRFQRAQRRMQKEVMAVATRLHPAEQRELLGWLRRWTT
jgi:RNA polymerase sigma-70 factor, ECF subfamily